MRNKQLLTDKENERAFVDMVENVVGGKIELKYTNMNECNVETFNGMERKQYYVITLGKIKGVDRFTLLNHEVGHILADSPLKSADSMITEWAKEWKADAIVSLDTLRYTYWYALNLIEDQRIESFMSKLYLNNKKRFYKAKVIVGREYTSMAQSSLQTLEYVRFLRDDLCVTQSFAGSPLHSSYDLAKEVLNKVEGTGQTGALLGLKMFKPLIDDYINEMIHNEHNWRPDLYNWGLPPDFKESNSVDTSYLHHDSFEDSRRDGEKVIQKIKEKLSGTIDPSDITTRDIIIDDGDVCIGVGNPNQEIAGGMNRVFRKLCEMPKEIIGYDGDEIDIESYIINKAQQTNIEECFIDTKYVSGISILISVDGSSSMDNDNGYSSMDCARDMVATLYKSIEGISNVNLKTIIWSANLGGIMNITEVNSMGDTSKIRTARDYPCTPTHMAIEYSTKMISRMKGRKKLLIFITDGSPEYMKNLVFIPSETLVKMGSNAMIKGLRRCSSIMAMLIKPSDYAKECCDRIFGNRLMTVDNMQDGSDIIMNKFKRLVMGVLR